jgi:hypothetical protein
MELTQSNKLLFAPQIYEGKIYEYDLKNRKLNQVVTGYSYKENAFYSYNYDISSREIPYSRIRDRGETFWGSIRVINGGLFEMSNGDIVHFSFVYKNKEEREENEAKWSLFVEIFDKDYKLLGVDLLTQMDGGIYGKAVTNTLVNWKDEHDNFYLLSSSDKGEPMIQQFRIKY